MGGSMMNLKKVLIGSVVSILVSSIPQAILAFGVISSTQIVTIVICDTLTYLLVGIAVSLVASQANMSNVAVVVIVSIATLVASTLGPVAGVLLVSYYFYGREPSMTQFLALIEIASFILGFGVGYLLTRIHSARLLSAKNGLL
jgi:hypothetical protein